MLAKRRSSISDDGTTTTDTKVKMAIEKREIPCGRLCFKLKKRLIECLIWSVATYRAETWTLSADAIKKLEMAEVKRS